MPRTTSHLRQQGVGFDKVRLPSAEIVPSFLPYLPLATQGLKGPQGDAGPQGDTGAQGPQGDDGTQGPQGLTGAQGDDGAQGPQGDDGAQGPQGTPGTSSTTTTVQTADVAVIAQDRHIFTLAVPGAVVGDPVSVNPQERLPGGVSLNLMIEWARVSASDAVEVALFAGGVDAPPTTISTGILNWNVTLL